MNNGGPAFQINFEAFKEGMTLRDYFAAKAMQGMAAVYHTNWSSEVIAENAYQIADKMMKERGL